MSKKPPLTLVGPDATGIAPPRVLGAAGSHLWRSVQNEFAITDSGGIALLMLACETQDLAADLAKSIETNGVVLRSNRGIKPNPSVKDLLGARALVARTLEKLGVTSEAIKTPGRPCANLGWMGDT